MMAGPPLQWITIIKILMRKLEVLLNLVHECLKKVSVVSCKINLLRRAIYCRHWYNRDRESWEQFIIVGMEMGIKILFGSLKVCVGIEIVTAVHKKATI